MNSGRRSPTQARSASAASVSTGSPGTGVTQATSRTSCGPKAWVPATARSTDGWAASTASISPSSMRKPRSLTW